MCGDIQAMLEAAEQMLCNSKTQWDSSDGGVGRVLIENAEERLCLAVRTAMCASAGDPRAEGCCHWHGTVRSLVVLQRRRKKETQEKTKPLFTESSSSDAVEIDKDRCQCCQDAPSPERGQQNLTVMKEQGERRRHHRWR